MPPKAAFNISRGRRMFPLLIGAVIGMLLVWAGWHGIHYTSSDMFCAVCHVHPHVEISWKKSTHFKNKSGVVIHCAECHLPPGGLDYLLEKARLGIRDSWGYLFKDKKKIDWDAKSAIERAVAYTYDASCLKCHQDLYSLNLTTKGVKAHEYYTASKAKLKEKRFPKETAESFKKLRCINCHLAVGHYREKPPEEMLIVVEVEVKPPVYPPDTGEFRNYTEVIPESSIAFNMAAIPGGTFTMGSPEDEPCRSDDEGAAGEVEVGPFWMGEIEVTWNEYILFYNRTATRGKTNRENIPAQTEIGTGKSAFAGPEAESEAETGAEADSVQVDAVTGPTPPYGSPDQGWGKGLKPAITMTHHAAMVYCEWLSEVTGKKYRLPTEAEWEYACRAGTAGPYFFEGDPKKLTRRSWRNRLFGTDYTVIGQYVWFAGNSGGKTQPPYRNKPNPWGLYNMAGNVREFCLDLYAPDTYSAGLRTGQSADVQGTGDVKEHVIRGGSYLSDPADLRSAARDLTRHDKWLVTDPQSPKSVWWYSDSKDVGFRVVREFEGEAGN